MTKVKALAVFSSDALSSVAYATEEIMKVLVLVGVGVLYLTLPISGVIVLLLAIVVLSYRQTIRAYPSGGGSYIVANDNLGMLAGLTAAGALLVDYVLTVSVSIASGVAQITSLLPEWIPYEVPLAVGAVVLIMLANLPGIRESGSIFAVPTYVFVALMYVLIGYALYQMFFAGGRADVRATGISTPADRRSTRTVRHSACVCPGLHGDDGHGGDLQWGASIQVARIRKRTRNTRGNGRLAGNHVPWTVVSGGPAGRVARR